MHTRSSSGVRPGGRTPNILSVDVEDWFHVLDAEGAPPRRRWGGLESRVLANTERLLELFERAGAEATFFVVGWVAWRVPEVVRRVAAAGHEVGCHSFWHELLGRYDRPALAADLSTSRKLLQDLSGQSVEGFRAPGASLRPDVAWTLDLLLEQGFSYDASLCAGRVSHGGFPSPFLGPHLIRCRSGTIPEIPWSTTGLGPLRLPWAGGGYLRLFPGRAVTRLIRWENHRGRPAVLYVHPREVDPSQPRMPLSTRRRFKYYVGLKGLEAKLARLLSRHRFVSAGAWLKAHGSSLEGRILDLRPQIEAASAHLADPALIPPPPPIEARAAAIPRPAELHPPRSADAPEADR